MQPWKAPSIEVFLAPLALLPLLLVGSPIVPGPIIQLPVTHASPGPDRGCHLLDGLFLSLSADRQLYRDHKPIDLDAIPRAGVMVLEADARLTYGDVAPILRKLRGRGARVCLLTAALE